MYLLGFPKTKFTFWLYYIIFKTEIMGQFRCDLEDFGSKETRKDDHVYNISY